MYRPVATSLGVAGSRVRAIARNHDVPGGNAQRRRPDTVTTATLHHSRRSDHNSCHDRRVANSRWDGGGWRARRT